MDDQSNGYESIAPIFLAGRGRDGSIGLREVTAWARSLPQGASVLDLGCGSGIPVTAALIAEGCTVTGIDASATMIAAFRRNFPDAKAEHAAAEDFVFADDYYQAAIAWGLLFLLDEKTQQAVIVKVANALPKSGFLVFTAPQERCSWLDAMTGQESISLGEDAYCSILRDAGLQPTGEEQIDEGGNFYYFSVKR